MMKEMPEIGSRVRFPWETDEREGVVTEQLGTDTHVPRVRVRPDGETADVEFRVELVEPVSE